VSRSSNEIAKRMRDGQPLVRESPGPDPPGPPRDEPGDTSRPPRARLREDWFERTYERVRGFLDQMFR
jgi:hypothetical protein